MVIQTLHPQSNTGISAMINVEQLTDFIELLESQGIQYALVGGAALLTMDDFVRPTDDFDFIVAREDIDGLQGLEKESSDRNFGRYVYQGTRIDALYPDNPIFAYVLAHHLETVEIAGKPVTRGTPEGIILLKLYALPSLYQQGQQRRAMTYEADISGLLLQTPNIDTEALLTVLARLGEVQPSQVHELRNILDECLARTQSRNF